MFKIAAICTVLIATLVGATRVEARAEVPQLGTCYMVEQPGGVVAFSALLPSGLAYVELFSRQNRSQNVALPIQLSEVPVGEGYSLYSYQRAGYLDGDLVECRVYYYPPASGGVFGPGPGAGSWESIVYREAGEWPPERQATISDLGCGRVLFQALLPSGQAFVQFFARTNGVLDVAQAVQLSGVDQGNGWALYTLEQDGFVSGDEIDLRVYSYLPAGPGLFTPGPSEQSWTTWTYP